MEKIRIKIIVGSTREARFSDKPASWIYQELQKIESADVELLDLRDYSMPFYDSALTPGRMGGKYNNEAIQRWSGKIAEGDAFVIVTPEYNHGYTAVLKNALDVIGPEWSKKAVGFVGYGSALGARAIEQLREVVIELDMVPIKRSIHMPFDVYLAAGQEKVPVNPQVFAPIVNGRTGNHLQMFIDNLLWMAKALKAAR